MEDGRSTLSTNLNTLAQGSSLAFSDGATTLRTGLAAYTDGVGQLGNGLNQMAGQLSKLGIWCQSIK